MKKCGPECIMCDCGRTNNKCKFYSNKEKKFILSKKSGPPKKKSSKR